VGARKIRIGQQFLAFTSLRRLSLLRRIFTRTAVERRKSARAHRFSSAIVHSFYNRVLGSKKVHKLAHGCALHVIYMKHR
jgi:hypothetical protein